MLDILMMAFGTIDLNSIGQMLIDNGVFAVLFGWLFFDTRKEAKNREERLLDHIERQGEALDKVADTIERMDIRLSYIEQKVDKK
ncbi:BhlA/UviB family holin-like peptide [Priestia sp. FSL R5-0597]|uniref:BhlA/UviB family holin-like peptide n=1 Tax=Priestia TaxID=2800373 RepID=UPI001EEB8E18|nr:BhlA/UviB family holin-like peptide [Priestia megaterium]